jgi:hypothetical protein
MCLIQVVLLMFAWVLASKFVRIGLEHQEHYAQTFPWLVRFRDYGLMLLVFPIIISAVCTRLTLTHRDITILDSGGLGLAIISTVAVAFFPPQSSLLR